MSMHGLARKCICEGILLAFLGQGTRYTSSSAALCSLILHMQCFVWLSSAMFHALTKMMNWLHVVLLTLRSLGWTPWGQTALALTSSVSDSCGRGCRSYGHRISLGAAFVPCPHAATCSIAWTEAQVAIHKMSSQQSMIKIAQTWFCYSSIGRHQSGKDWQLAADILVCTFKTDLLVS